MDELTIAGYLVGFMCFCLTFGIIYATLWCMKDDFGDSERAVTGAALMVLTSITAFALYTLMYFYLRKRTDVTFTGMLSYLSGRYPAFLVISILTLCGIVALILIISLCCAVYSMCTDEDGNGKYIFLSLSIGLAVLAVLSKLGI